jgi:tetratricopeptide (TPR) repeat protein
VTVVNDIVAVRHSRRLGAGVAQSTTVFFVSSAATCFYALPLMVLLSVPAGGFSTAVAFPAARNGAGPDKPIVAPPSPVEKDAQRDAKRASESGDHAGAVKVLTRAIEQLGPRNPATAYLYLDRGAAYRKLGQLDQALHDTDEALTFPTMAPVGHYARAKVLMSMKRYEQALAAFDDYLARGDKFAFVYVERALALTELGRFADAVANFDTALQASPDEAGLWFHRGSANTKAGNIDAAIADYTRSITLKPRALVYYVRGNLFTDRQRYATAVADYSHVLELDPKWVGAYVKRGNAYSRLGNHEAALGDYNAAIKIDPNDIDAYRNRGLLYAWQGKRDLARADYEQGLKLSPNDQWLIEHLKTIDPIEAVAVYDAALRSAPDDPSLWSKRAEFNKLAGNIDAAIADYTRTIDLAPGAMAYYLRGNLYRDTKRYEAAVADYSRALELDPKMVGAYNDRGNAYLRLEKYDAVLADYTAAIEIDPDYVTAYRNRGLFYLFRGQRELARADYERGLKLLPNDQWLKDQLKNIDEIKQK